MDKNLNEYNLQHKKMNKRELLNQLYSASEWIDEVVDHDREQHHQDMMDSIDKAHTIISKLKAPQIKEFLKNS